MAKVMVSLPDELLARIDAEARRRETTRSALLADAARRELESPAQEVRRRAAARLEARAARYGWPTSEDLLADKAERDAGTPRQ
ncbi:MAG: ribbon-helix-helix domain-containing protein [Actinomycetota bacterium]|nr:ribbon-helix-helix domain-containing protein [Actinomycetota bacterium]